MGMIATGEKADRLTAGIQDDEFVLDGSFRQLSSVSGDASFVGCFDYQGWTALYVVNASRNDRATVGLHFDNVYAYDVTQRAETVSVVGKNMELNLQPGEGV